MTDENDNPDASGIVRDPPFDVTGSFTVRMKDEDGNVTQTFEDCEIKTEEQARQEYEERREQAPEPESLGERTADIDDVIAALEAAKERGVDRVLVNDDGRTRDCDPRITNNHYEASPMAPPPGSLTEWLEL